MEQVKKYISLSIIFATTCFVLYWTILANTDLTLGGHVLFMDERITFYGVKHILHPSSLWDFIYAVFDGGDYRYGRCLWNVIAIFAFIPEMIWGEPGQIIASRMCQVVIFISTCYFFILGFLKDWLVRGLAFISIIFVPYSYYYMTMPKPEPLTLLFLLIFLYYYGRNNFHFGKFWFYLGASFGAKIAVLPVIVLSLAWTLYLYKKERRLFFSDTFYAFLWSALGFLCSVPAFTPIFLPSYFAYRVFHQKFGLKRKTFSFTAFIFISLCLIFLKICTHYIGSTFLNMTHGGDSPDINFFSWINYILTNWSGAPGWLLGITCLAIVLSTLIALCRDFKIDISTAFIIAGLALNGSIMISAKRLWGMYLFLGTFLFACGSWLFIVRRNAIYLKAIAFVLIICSLFWSNDLIIKCKELSMRTESEQYLAALKQYNCVRNFIKKILLLSPNRHLRIANDASMFYFTNFKQVKFHEIYGWHMDWDSSFDVVVYHNKIELDGLRFEVIKHPEFVYLKSFYLFFTNNKDHYIFDYSTIPGGTLIYKKDLLH